MKRIILLLLLIIPIFSCNTDRLKDGEYELNIYATNDLHGRLFDSLYVSKGDIELNSHSLASVSSLIKELRANGGEQKMILLDLGDHLQGDNSVFYYNFVDTTSEHIFATVANYLKYDAVVVGNHDIETGHKVYDKVTKELKMPYLAANAVNTSSGAPYFKPYTIINRGPLKVAVIGLTNPNIPNWLSPELWEGIKFEEIKSTLEYWVEYLNKKEKPHIIVVAMHAGVGDIESNALENPARYVAKMVDGIDLVFASHDHKEINETITNVNGKEILLLEGGSRAAYLSAAQLTIKVRDGKVAQIVSKGECIKIDSIPADKEYLEKFRPQFLKIKEFTNKKVGTLTGQISSRDAYFGPSTYIDMIHGIQLSISGADVSFAAPLNYDYTKEAGELNFQDLLDIYPYENQLYVIEMSGREIRDYLEFSYSKWIDLNPLANGHILQFNMSGRAKDERSRFANIFFNFDSAAGVLYEVDVTKPIGERVLIKGMANGAQFESDKKYKVALSSYRASGGGNLLSEGAKISKEELKERELYKYNDIRELIYNKLQEDGKLDAKLLNHWQFTPQNLVMPLIAKDRALLFNN